MVSRSRHQQAYKVGFVTAEYPPTLGGLAKAAARLVRFLVEAGMEVHVLVGVEGSPQTGFPEPAREDGALVYRIPVSFSKALGLTKEAVTDYAFRMSFTLLQLDSRHGFDLFHGFFVTTAYPCLVAAERGRRPFLASIRGSDAVNFSNQPLLRTPTLQVLEKATWVTSVNASHLVRVAARVDLTDRSSVIPNSIAMDGLTAWQPTVANRGVVGTVGRFRKVKNTPLLIDAYAHLPSELRQKLVLVGCFDDDAEGDRAEATLRRYRVASEVQLTGLVPFEDVITQLYAMRVFVMCSDHEGFPNALLEAAALGVPLVATAVGGMKEFLQDGQNALLVPPGDPRSLTDALAQVLGNEAVVARLSAGARDLAQRFHPQREKKAWIDLYYRLLTTPSPRE